MQQERKKNTQTQIIEVLQEKPQKQWRSTEIAEQIGKTRRCVGEKMRSLRTIVDQIQYELHDDPRPHYTYTWRQDDQ